MKKILLIEDDPFVLLGLSEFLKTENFEIITAVNGIEGIHSALNHHPDLILLDVMIPKINGFEICSNLRESKFKNPIILMTSFKNIYIKNKILECGADDYIFKPFKMKNVLEKIKSFLNLEYK